MAKLNEDYIAKYHLQTTTADSGGLEIRLTDLPIQEQNFDDLLELSMSRTQTLINKSYGVRTVSGSERPIKMGGKDYFNMRLLPGSLLLESLKDKRKPLVGLRYHVENFDINVVYVQSASGVTQEDFISTAQDLGVNPHELLLAHFIARLSPALDQKPETNVRFDQQYRCLYKKLRERFFDKDWNLNPRKERVAQLLGSENAWIQYRS